MRAALILTVLLVAPAAGAQEALTTSDPIAGFSGDTAYLRSPDNSFVLMPHGRVQIDGLFYKRDTERMPNDTINIRRARLELFGWVGRWIGFSLAAEFAGGPPPGPDPVAPINLSTTDNFVLVAPVGDLAILQVGQFDVPFTLENRTSDKYFDFMERSVTVRAFGVPHNKDSGAMVHGLAPGAVAYWSAGVFNGDGMNFRNVDSDFDVMGRAWVAPLAIAGVPELANVTVGGSLWHGTRGRNGLAVPAQTTQGGFRFFDPRFRASEAAGGMAAELHQRGDLDAWAVELDAPIGHRTGVRFELLQKSQRIAESDITNATSGRLVEMGHGVLDGWAAYGQAWLWIIGDDRLVGRPGLQLPPRLRQRPVEEPSHGLMVTARVERLEETVSSDTPALGDPQVGATRVSVFEVGANYWYSRRFRGTFNYVLNRFSGTSGAMNDLVDGPRGVSGGTTEHEVMFRLGIAL